MGWSLQVRSNATLSEYCSGSVLRLVCLTTAENHQDAGLANIPGLHSTTRLPDAPLHTLRNYPISHNFLSKLQGLNSLMKNDPSPASLSRRTLSPIGERGG